MTIFVVQKHDIMSLEQVVQNRISNMKNSLKVLKSNPSLEQNHGIMEDYLDFLEGLLEESRETTDQQVDVKLTLSVPINMDIILLQEKLKSLVELSGEVTVMSIEGKEEAKIYSNE